MRILVVDDELVSRKKLKKIMESFGECDAVENGKEAIAAFVKSLENWNLYSLITLDVSMPGMDGTEVLSKLREIEKENYMAEEEQAKILMVTSHSEKDTVMTSIEAGCDDYIVKPFNKEVVTKKLENLGFCR
ncbi:MAG: response regulator [Deltaproteobacteria bacterium]|nr:response regulator [Deltaproteobacteria bacterium]